MKKFTLLFAILFCSLILIACSRDMSDSSTKRYEGQQEQLADSNSEASFSGEADRNFFDEFTNGERYAEVIENPFLETKRAPISIFSTDVDTASYSNVRRYIMDGSLPPKDAVRTEEMINYFSYSYPQPIGNIPFSVTSEVASAPWNPKNKVLQIGLKGKDISLADIPPSNLVFLVDVSGSMYDEDKLPLLKSGLKTLIAKLSSKDRIAIVTYAGNSGIALPSTKASDNERLIAGIDSLEAGGGTAGAAGIALAYSVAQENFIEGGNNRVILATDGDFNVGPANDEELVKIIEEKRKGNVFLSLLGFGKENLNDSMLEKLSNAGNGNYAYIDSQKEARRALDTQIAGMLYVIAKDVKIQVEFNPKLVASYRLIGYENRMQSKKDFNDDKKDAGDIGAGLSVTALYEIVPSADRTLAKTQIRENGTDNTLGPNDSNGELAKVKLRYKLPNGDKSMLLSYGVLNTEKSIVKASPNLKVASAVAQFGMLLRDSKFKGDSNYKSIISPAKSAGGQVSDPSRQEFIQLLELASRFKTNQSAE